MNSNRQPNNGRGVPPGGYSGAAGGAPRGNTPRNAYPNRPPQNTPNRQSMNGAPQGGYRQNMNGAPQGGYRQNMNGVPQGGYRQPGAVSRGAAPNSSMSRLAGQTPNQRRAEPKRVRMSAEQMEINRSNRRREKYYIKKRRSQMVKTFFSRFLLFLVIFALMFGLCSAIFYMDLTRTNSGVSGYSYNIGGKSYSLDASKAMHDGRVYVNFRISRRCAGLLSLARPRISNM